MYITWLSSWCLQGNLGWWLFDSLVPDFLQNHILFLCQCLCLHINNCFSTCFPIFFLEWFFSSVFPFLSVFPLKLILYSVVSKAAHFLAMFSFSSSFFFCVCVFSEGLFLAVSSPFLVSFVSIFVFLWSWCYGPNPFIFGFCFSEQIAHLIEFFHLHITCVICLFLCAVVSLFITWMQFCLQWLGEH